MAPRALLAALACACAAHARPAAPACVLETRADYGPRGDAPVDAETVVDGLEVPWSLAFLPGGDALVSERPGRVRLLSRGALVPKPVLTVDVPDTEEGGLLGIAVNPKDPAQLFVYRTAADGSGNRVERWKLAADHRGAAPEATLLRGIAASPYHNGGRIRFGPDGNLWIGTGDAREPALSRDPRSPNGKLLRIRPDGTIPSDNPRPGNPLWLMGVRNLEAFDWLDDGRVVLADHGPSGDTGRQGHDEIDVARKGDDLGWPTTWSCETAPGLLTPVLVWERAVPPGGALLYRGSAIPEWTGSFLVASLRSEHLHRVQLDRDGRVVRHEVYFAGRFGRLREIVTTPAGELWVTTSNCDGRGRCGPRKDRILRVLRR